MSAFDEYLAVGRKLWDDLADADTEAELLHEVNELTTHGLRAVVTERAFHAHRGGPEYDALIQSTDPAELRKREQRVTSIELWQHKGDE